MLIQSRPTRPAGGSSRDAGKWQPWVPAVSQCIALVALALVVMVPVPAISREVPPYEGRFTAKSDRMYTEDIHVWAYSAGFAERFRMPEQWIEPDLSGAQALAYRVEFDAGRVCGYAGDQDCRRRVRCVVDAYFKGDVPELFSNDLGTNHNAFGDDRSARFLSPQSERDFNQMRSIRRSVEMPGEGVIGYQSDDGRWHDGGRFNTYQHERRALAPYGVVTVSFQMPCTFGEIAGHEPKQIRLWITEARLANGIDVAHLVETGSGKLPGHSLVRQITLPATYVERLYRHHVKQYSSHGPAHDERSLPEWRIGPNERKSYEQHFTSASGGLYPEDNHVWVYTRDFAKRFGMPGQWVDDTLEGAYALAYWLNEENSRWRGFFGDQSRCKTVRRCMMDVYLPKDANLPWYEPVPVNHRILEADYSGPILSPITETFKKAQWISKTAEYEFGEPLRNGSRKRYSIVVEIWGRAKTILGIPYSTKKNHSSAWIHEYDRRLFGMDRMRMSTLCVNPKGQKIQVTLKNYGILFSKAEVDLNEFESAYDIGDYAGGSYDELVAHRVEIPLQFLALQENLWVETSPT